MVREHFQGCPRSRIHFRIHLRWLRIAIYGQLFLNSVTQENNQQNKVHVTSKDDLLTGKIFSLFIGEAIKLNLYYNVRTFYCTDICTLVTKEIKR